VLIADRAARGLAQSFPDPPLTDSFGIPVAIRV
jgi:predicted RNase H-like nuclease